MVTYGDRGEILNKTIPHLINECCIDLVLVENNISRKTKIYLNEIKISRLHRIQLDYNSGSAGGYAEGLEYALKRFRNANKFLLLDDDNFISEEFVCKLVLKLNHLKFASCNRINRSKYNGKKCSENNFLGTNLFYREQNIINCAPYGGLIVSRELIEEVGLPNKKFFLYGDDHEFTLRATLFGYQLTVLEDIKIIDLDQSHDHKSKIHRYFQKNFDCDKLYFQIRNHTHISFLMKKSNFIFYTNLIFVLIILFSNNIKTLHFPMGRWRVIFKAIIDGKSFKSS